MKKLLGIGALVLGMAVTPALAGENQLKERTIDRSCATQQTSEGNIRFSGTIVDKLMTEHGLYVGFEEINAYISHLDKKRFSTYIANEDYAARTYTIIKTGDRVTFVIPKDKLVQGAWVETKASDDEGKLTRASDGTAIYTKFVEEQTIDSCGEASRARGVKIYSINEKKVEF